MKKGFLLFIVLLTGIVVMASSASAIIFTETKMFDSIPLGYPLQGIGTYSWEHFTPADFSVPHDKVNSATLTITAYVRDLNDTVSVQGTDLGVLNNSVNFYWTGSHPGLFDITDFFASWDKGDILNITLNYVEILPEDVLFFPPHIHSSVLTLDYTPVPEPASMLLLASGLVGLAGFRKRFKRS